MGQHVDRCINYLLLAIVMVAISTNKDGVRMVIHRRIPLVDVASHSAILGFVAISTATLKLPSTILLFIVMVTAYSCHHIVDVTPVVEGLVPVVHVSCPIAMGEWRGYNILTLEVPTAILTTIAVITLNTINSLVVAIHEKVAIEIILVSSYSIEC